METSYKDYNYWVSNREKYQKFSTKADYDKFLEALKKHEQQEATYDQ